MEFQNGPLPFVLQTPSRKLGLFGAGDAASLHGEFSQTVLPCELAVYFIEILYHTLQTLSTNKQKKFAGDR
jgi:hypothetical protein